MEEGEASCESTTRMLYDWERLEAERIFGSRLHYDRIRVHECAAWPNWIDQISRRLRRLPVRKSVNAITLGNHMFFPVRLPDHLLNSGHPQHYMISWLIHELTHCYQYQIMGWTYLFKALGSQMRENDAAYQFGSSKGLKQRRKEGWTFHQFNLEAQGDIARGYYDRLCKGEDVSDWEPYIRDIQEV